MQKTHYEIILESFPLMKEIFNELDTLNIGDTYTWEEFSEFPIIKRLYGQLVSAFSSEGAVSTLQIVYHTYAFKKGIGRVYDVAGGIAEMLLNTKLDVDTSIVQSPFTEIIVTVPPHLLNIYNERTGYHQVYTMYINLSKDRSLKVLCVGKTNKKSVNVLDDALFYFKIRLKEGKVSDSVKQEMEVWKESPLYDTFSTVNDTERFPRLFQFAINILLYITSSNNDLRLQRSERQSLIEKRDGLKSQAKIRKAQSKIDKASSFDHYVVGGSISIQSNDMAIAGFNTEGNKHSVRYPVGGHWRMQPCGPSMSLRKHIWIKPHLRGPEFANLIKNVGVIK